MNRIHYIYIIALLLLLGAAMPLHAQTIRGKIYGGGELATVNGDAKVEVLTGTVGDGEAFDGGVFGGGLGEPTIVTGNVEVLIGEEGSAIDATGPTINGDVYGGSALGNTNCTADLVATDEKTTSVTLNAGTINGSMYGGALGQKAGLGGATRDVTANVYGKVQVDVNGGIVLRRDGDDGGEYSGGIYGCNNWNGSPQTTVDVDIYHHNSAKPIEDKYTLFAVYGGGNQADYVAGTPNVEVHYCDNRINYVYGGGNAAHLTHETDDGDGNMMGDGNTNVIIWGCELIGNVFGGGNGQVQAANVSGNTNVTIYGGKILNVFGGSNTNGMIGGATNVHVLAQGEGDSDACSMALTNVYGGGNKAAGKSGTVNIACTGTGTIDNVYGGANMADLTGDIELNIRGGKIGNVFGGNNNSGNINGAITVNIDWATGGEACAENSLTNVYGGGNKALYSVYGYNDDGTAKDKADDQDPIAGPTVNLINGTVSNNVYGGGLGEAAVVTGNPVVNLNGATVQHNIFGGGSLAQTIGNPTVVVTLGSAVNVYGGGALADVTGDTYVSLMGGTVGNAYGGGLGKSGDDAIAAAVSGVANITLGKENVDGTFDGNCVVGNIFGCNDTYGAPAHAVVTTYSGTVDNVYGGGNQAAGNSAPVVYLVDGTIKNNVYGGGLGESAVITGDPVVNLWGATIGTWEDSVLKSGGNIFGGGEAAPVTGDPMVSTASGTAGNVYAGGFGATAVVTGNPTANIDQHAVLYVNVDEYNAAKGTDLTADAFEALDNTAKTRYTEKTLTVQNVFGGGSLAKTVGDPTVNVSGGKVVKDVYGGGALADVDGNTSVILTGGSVGDAYGGGLGSVDVAAEVVNSSVLVKEDADVNNVFGCNNTNGTPTGTVNVEIAGGTVNENVFGGGHLANATADPVVTVSGGTVTHDVYGGGALADVTGNTTVNLTGGAVGGAYGGALGQLASAADPEHDIPAKEAIAAYVNGNTTVTLNGTKITETGVFGANNLNGTPTGHVKVHVTKTTPRDGQTAYDPEHPENSNSYDVPAVYGGGNLSAYEPIINDNDDNDDNDTEDAFAEVLIENCENSIEYVYGGGKAAPVPATKVTIYGANAINHAFAGGNGKTDDGATTPNPGADVGYLGYHSTGSNVTYGTGQASITVYGGTVHNVYGGSNTLGYIRGGTSISVSEADGACPLNVGNVFGGGNEADIDCSVTMNLDCTEGGAILYAGANNANVNGDITLNIHSGIYGKVFCGNNTGGKILGKLEVNVDEVSTCWPVMIGELYACGNLAPYSVYGYADDGTILTEGTPKYADPVVNLISFTRIGKVFGGGYGEKAVLYGNTHVNVEPIPGKWAGNTAAPVYVLNGNDKRVLLSEATTLPYGVTNNGDNSITIAADAASIGDIYGGGNAGAVYGDTNVMIGLKTKNKHISGADTTTEEEVAVTITGNVFGGGNEAIVSGDTNVKVGE